MNRKFIAASVFSLISASIVQAADVVAPQEPMHVASEVVASSPFSWAGFYFGAQIGGFSSKISATTRDVDIPLYPDERSKNKPWVPVEKQYIPELSGVVGGLYAGVNFDIADNLIVGLDTDILLTEKKDTKIKFHAEESSTDGLVREGTEVDGGSGSDKDTEKERGFSRSATEDKEEQNTLTFNHTLKQKWTGATRVRLGGSAGRVMPYIAGGIAYGQFQDVLSTVITGDDPFNKTSDVTKTMIGYTIGGGIDFAMTDNLVVRAEYRYSDFGKKKFKDKIEVKYRTNDFRAGIAYRF
ncbi:outer membrane protein [Bartonella tribocorum]|uniref:Hemin-binding protein n=1 Tax=Bartonella tribocorum TaxID=85701 RepID=A0A2M6US03_9HYPH|nr:outer membrane beta-barrel protein [Bartonella tribocorum]PIT68970.1 hemin-binding protein [Bartonella tribocorum]